MIVTKRIKAAIILAVIIVMVSSMIIGCKREEEVLIEGKYGGTFRIYIHEPVSLDPPNCFESEGMQVIKQVWDGLVNYDPETLEVIPALAESWDIGSDGLIYTFNLRKGVKFHSGREVIAEDFVYSWSRAAHKDTASYLAYHLDPIAGFEECQEGKTDILSGVKAIDDYTLEVTLRYPYADFVNTLGHVVFFPVAKEDIEKWGDKYTENINGTGPFKFVSWEHDQYIELERNDDYWAGKPYLDKVRYVIFTDEDTAFLEFKAGNLEYASIPRGKVKATLEDTRWKDNAIIKPTLILYYYGINLDAEPYKDNPSLREALYYVIDRQYICDVIDEGVSIPATGIVPPGIPGFQENAWNFAYDPEMASKKLEEAGFPDGEGLPTLKLGYNTGSGHEFIAESIQADAREVGINIELEGYEWGTFTEKVIEGEINFYRWAWGADYPIMDNFLFPLFYSKSEDNNSRYNNPDVDKLLLEVRSTLDEEERIEKYRVIEKMILKDAAIVPIYFYGSTRIIQHYVKGFFLNSMEEYDLSKVWLEK